jgi:hypothetical protein
MTGLAERRHRPLVDRERGVLGHLERREALVSLPTPAEFAKPGLAPGFGFRAAGKSG